MSYRPITDVWLLARPKVKYYGAYPNGFLGRARALLGVTINDPVLHVCSGMAKDYPFDGFGPRDLTMDIDPELKPDIIGDVRDGIPRNLGIKAILADPPYSESDAEHYKCGPSVLPSPVSLVRKCLDVLEPGQRVGLLHYVCPSMGKSVKLVALVAVFMGMNNRARCFSVWERR